MSQIRNYCISAMSPEKSNIALYPFPSYFVDEKDVKYHAAKKDFFFSSLSLIPFPPSLCSKKLCSGSHKMYQMLSGSNYLFKECIKTCFKETPFFFFFSQGEKNINKKLIHSLTSCIRKLNQNKTENPMFKSKEKNYCCRFL